MIQFSFLFMLCGFCIAQHTPLSEPAVVYHTNIKYEPSYFNCSSTSYAIKYSPYISVSNIVGLQTDCVFNADSFYITLWTEDKPYTGILKAALPFIAAFAVKGVGITDASNQDAFNSVCKDLIDKLIKVWISVDSEYDLQIDPQTVSLDSGGENCIGYYQFFSKIGKFKVMKSAIKQDELNSENAIVFMSDDLLSSSFEYYELKYCSSEKKPMKLRHGGAVQNPMAVLDGEYPSGTQCYYQVVPEADHCHTVLFFEQSPFETREECELWAIEASFVHTNGTKVTESYDCSNLVENAHANPPWIIHSSDPLVKLRFGKATGIPSSADRLDRFKLRASCLHTDAHDEEALVCSSECDNKEEEASHYARPCYGRSARECVACKYAIDESQCVSQCPADKFKNEMKVCEMCNYRCLGEQSCLSRFQLGCFKVCSNEEPFRVMKHTKRQTVEFDNEETYLGYYAEQNSFSCKPRCVTGMAAIFIINGTFYENEERYMTPQGALDNNLLDKMDAQCATTCPVGYEKGRCVKSGPYKNMDWCCAIVPSEMSFVTKLLIFALVPMISGALLVLLIVLIIYGIKRHRKTEWKKIEALRAFYVGEGKSNIRGIANRGQLLIVEPDAIEKKQVIGQGAFGCVYSALWKPPNENIEIPVAVKELKNDPRLANQSNELLEEAKLMATVNHDNLVRLIAISMNEPMMLITKFMTHGGSIQFIVRHKDIMTSYQFMEWARQLAAGMAHLESLGMIHRDLAARNVLVEDPKRIRISDFGLSKLLDADKDEQDYQADDSKLPIRWLAKECLTGRLFSHKSDVWAYGVTLWEFFVYGVDKPYGKVDLQTVKDLVIRGRRLVQPQTCSLELYTQMLKCWMTVPDSRPSFTYLENWFAESRDCASKYFFTKYRNEPLEAPAKLQSNIVNLSSTSNNSNEQHQNEQPLQMGMGGDHVGNNDAPPLNYMDVYRPSTGKSNAPSNENFSQRTTAEADVKPWERVADGGPRGGKPNRGAQGGGFEQHQGDNSVPRREDSGSDEEYLMPQKRPPPPALLGSAPPLGPNPNSSHFREVEEDEYLRPVPMPRSVNEPDSRRIPRVPNPTSSVEADNSGGIHDFSIETRENELQKYFPGIDVKKFDKAHNIMEKDYDSSLEPSNYKASRQASTDVNDENEMKNSRENMNGSDKNLDRKGKARISQRWKDKKIKPPLQQQDNVNPSGDYSDVATRQPHPSSSQHNVQAGGQSGTGNEGQQRVAPAESMRRYLPAESSV
ncbi:receptor tyrosine-protein kinase erbB-2-like isoform X4 [Symsagittifera roscoffensis]|uniref:receptor tyrosine-protein kinase erbB-2-like isoform X4 n=1 Tax=Symsagittifera roscoffensis TaxID=84072 RepID=UPI00307BDC5A